jgi:hypothetical protein
MGPLAEIKRTSSFHPTPHFFDGHRRPRLYRTYILNQLISLFKYPFELSAKPNLGGTGGHFDPRIVQTSPFYMILEFAVSFRQLLSHFVRPRHRITVVPRVGIKLHGLADFEFMHGATPLLNRREHYRTLSHRRLKSGPWPVMS